MLGLGRFGGLGRSAGGGVECVATMDFSWNMDTMHGQHTVDTTHDVSRKKYIKDTRERRACL